MSALKTFDVLKAEINSKVPAIHPYISQCSVQECIDYLIMHDHLGAEIGSAYLARYEEIHDQVDLGKDEFIEFMKLFTILLKRCVVSVTLILLIF